MIKETIQERPADLAAGLKKQHQEWMRQPWSKHNVNSGITDMHTLSLRRSRRRWNRRLKQEVKYYNDNMEEESNRRKKICLNDR